MSQPPPVSPWRRIAEMARTALLMGAGWLIDTLGVVNVPGAAVFDRAGQPQITALGIAAWLLISACWLSVPLRRRAPWAPLVAGAVPLIVGSTYVLFLVGVVIVTRRRSARPGVIWAIAAVALLIFVIRELLTPWGAAFGHFFLLGAEGTVDAVAASIASPVIAVLSIATALGVWLYQRTRGERDANRDRADRAQLRADALGEQVARQAERERLARDIHDALSHRLSAISLQAGAFEASAATDELLVNRARTLREQAHASLEDLRGLLGQLRMERPAEDAPPSLTSMKAVGQLLRGLRAGGTAIDAYVVIDDADRASAVLDTAVYRIVQESLTNAIKHAAGAPVSVYVEVSATTGARIRVTNPLRPGASLPPGSGQGVVGVRQRAEALQGTAWIGPSQGAFIVDVTLPWSERG
ncbi:sensor histidine kinase [Microbacterium marinilacus]|uniref:histidine kinase n=1 Tax=Microbacterium marinilacus TaxID=415209 RepID=A0ABP7BHT5_9MICO|nr:histidine kinase [Microbacterium marinilacus]MBY0690148.1 hypothetical protein [Microbacterium marinilacus]